MIMNEFPKFVNLVFKTNQNRREKWWRSKISNNKDFKSSQTFSSPKISL